MEETEQKNLPSKPIGVSVPQEMRDYLESHPEINRSKIFQDAVFLRMHPQAKKVSSQIVLMMFMNFIIAMAIIFVSLWMPAVSDNQYLKMSLIFLALILTVVSLMTYRSEKTKIKK